MLNQHANSIEAHGKLYDVHRSNRSRSKFVCAEKMITEICVKIGKWQMLSGPPPGLFRDSV